MLPNQFLKKEIVGIVTLFVVEKLTQRLKISVFNFVFYQICHIEKIGAKGILRSEEEC